MKSFNKRRAVSLTLAIAFSLFRLAHVHAQAQPAGSRPLTIVVPYPAGGGADALARAMQPTLARVLGQNVIVENVSGAAGTLGVQRVVSAPADGNTLLMGSPNEVILAPLAMHLAKYRPEDMRMLATVTNVPLVIMARKDLPVASLDELVSLAAERRATPITLGSVGYGSMYHMVGEYLGKVAGVPFLHIPYKGTTPLVQDLVGQQVDFAVLPNVGLPTEMLHAGNMRALTVLDGKRMASLPATQAVSETALGQRERLLFTVWAAVLVRKDVPEPQVQRLHAALREAIASDEIARTLSASGAQAAPASPLAATASFYSDEMVRFRTWAQAINLRPQ